MPLRGNGRIEAFVSDQIQFAISVIERPKRQIIVLATDPKEGIYCISEDRADYLLDFSATCDQTDLEPFGKVSYIAFNASKNMFAMYADAEQNGNVIVALTNLSQELNR